MSSDENQQALAWQQIIKNRAFYNVKMRGDESWVDAACRTLDELIDQKEQAEKSLSEFLESQLTSRDDELTQLDEARIEANIQRNKAQRERDAEASRADYLNKKFAKLMFDYQDVEDERDEWKARAEKAPAVSRANVERVVHRYIDGGFDELHISRVKSATDAFMALLSGDDPTVFVVRESDISAVEVKRDTEGDWWTENHGCGEGATVDGMRKMAEILIRDAIEYEAIARAIEAEQAADPIEEKAAEFYDLAGRVGDDIWAACRNIAAHVLGQEDRHVNQ